jgi:SAM-dependent methyltransferase
MSRGTPIDRYYIDQFLRRSSSEIRGRVLEVKSDDYARLYGDPKRVLSVDVLDILTDNKRANLHVDLAHADAIPEGSYDCFILTQTLHMIYDLRAALRTIHRILKPGGVVLVTVPCISQIDRYDWGGDWFWGFTHIVARRLFEEIFPAENVEVEGHGNVLTATAFLQGLSASELDKAELDYRDSCYDLTVTIRAVKPV